jgi:hypothetical protein
MKKLLMRASLVVAIAGLASVSVGQTEAEQPRDNACNQTLNQLSAKANQIEAANNHIEALKKALATQDKGSHGWRNIAAQLKGAQAKLTRLCKEYSSIRPDRKCHIMLPPPPKSCVPCRLKCGPRPVPK